MKKELSEMTLEELWKLFPIYLVEPNYSLWHQYYEEEKERILGFLNIKNVKIHHIGSTAIKGIWAKPIIDILLEVPNDSSLEKAKTMLISNGYICMLEQKTRKSFNRGYTKDGFAEKVFHLHLREYGDRDEVYFRNYMNKNETLKKEYEKLKLSLLPEYKYDRDGYTNAKTSFIMKYTNIAKQEQSNRKGATNENRLNYNS